MSPTPSSVGSDFFWPWDYSSSYLFVSVFSVWKVDERISGIIKKDFNKQQDIEEERGEEGVILKYV